MLALLLLLGLQNPAPAKPAAATAAAAAKTPPGPKSAVDLTADLNAALKTDPLAQDTISVTIEGDTVTLVGTIRAAEDKGIATRVARAVAQRDGWGAAHVVNHLAVQSAHLN